MGGNSQKRYTVEAKRQNEDKWTEWIRTDDYIVATRQMRIVKALGHCSRIIDNEETENKGENHEN